jgi:hypothetical protein
MAALPSDIFAAWPVSADNPEDTRVNLSLNLPGCFELLAAIEVAHGAAALEGNVNSGINRAYFHNRLAEAFLAAGGMEATLEAIQRLEQQAEGS